MSTLIERYTKEYGSKKKSSGRETSILKRIQRELGNYFVREVEGPAIQRWFGGLTEGGLCAGTAVRHFNVMHHMMEKACTIWSKETGIDRNLADQIEVKRPDDQRERHLSAEEIVSLKRCLDQKMYRGGTREMNRTYYRLRMIRRRPHCSPREVEARQNSVRTIDARTGERTPEVPGSSRGRTSLPSEAGCERGTPEGGE